MRLHIVAVGKRIPDWAEQGCAEFARRVRGDCSVQVRAVAASRRGVKEIAARQREESDALLRAVPQAALVVALEVDGESWSTRELARRFEQWRATRRDVAFLIGGADGLAASCRTAASHCWSLSALTLPHALARLLVAEQLYRAWSLAHGHPYHH